MRLEEALAWVPGYEPGLTIAQPLPSGVHNRAFRIDTREGCFVLRLQPDGRAAILGANRQREAALHAAAATHGLAPGVVYADPGGQCLVTEYVAGRRWSADDMQDPAALERLGHLLRTLHAIDPPRVAPLRIDALIRQHCRRLARAFPAERAALRRLVADCAAQLEAIGSSRRRPAIVHNDLHHSNIIDGPRLVLIDWEYAGVGDPLFDLACVLAYYPESQKMAAMLLEWSGLAACATVAMLRTSAALFRTLSDLWARVGHLNSES